MRLGSRVGLAVPRPEMRPDPREVDGILEVPVADLVAPERLHTETREYFGREIRVPYFDVCGEKVWGATAMILSEWLTLLGVPPSPPR